MDFYSGVFVGAIIAAILITLYEYFTKREDEFYLDPEAADRISKVVEENPMCLSDCADVLEAVAPFCTMWTTSGFLRRLREVLQLYESFIDRFNDIGLVNTVPPEELRKTL